MDVVVELETMRKTAERAAVSFSSAVDNDRECDDEHRREQYLKIANTAERQIYALRQAIKAVSASAAANLKEQKIKAEHNEHKKRVLSWLDTMPGSSFGVPSKPKENPFYPK